MISIIKRKIKKKKGFTLVEVIVVLVIIAILAAVAIPALTGYISDAKEKVAISEARNILVGLQRLAITDTLDNEIVIRESYFANCTPGQYPLTGCDLSEKGSTKLASLMGTSDEKLVHPNNNPNHEGLDGIVIENGKITKFFYISDGFKITYKNDEFKGEKLS